MSGNNSLPQKCTAVYLHSWAFTGGYPDIKKHGRLKIVGEGTVGERETGGKRSITSCLVKV